MLRKPTAAMTCACATVTSKSRRISHGSPEAEGPSRACLAIRSLETWTDRARAGVPSPPGGSSVAEAWDAVLLI